MNVLYIYIIVHMDTDVKICLDHFGIKDYPKVNSIISSLFFNRCIRERNCGTGYQVDPTTQTCKGKKTVVT